MYCVYMYGLNGEEHTREFENSTIAISLALDWKAKNEYHRAEVYYLTECRMVRVL